MDAFQSANSSDSSIPSDIVPRTRVNVRSPPGQEADLQLLPAGLRPCPAAVDVFPPFINNIYMPNSAHNDIVQYFHVDPRAGLDVPEPQNSRLYHPLLSSPYIRNLNNTSSTSNHYSSRPRPLTILKSHNYVYPCWWFDDHYCNHMIEADVHQLSLHLKEHHGIQGGSKDSFNCLWQGCLMDIKHNGLPRHIITHLGPKIRCLNCWKKMARPDCARAHQKKNHVGSEATFQVIPGPSALYSSQPVHL